MRWVQGLPRFDAPLRLPQLRALKRTQYGDDDGGVGRGRFGGGGVRRSRMSAVEFDAFARGLDAQLGQRKKYASVEEEQVPFVVVIVVCVLGTA